MQAIGVRVVDTERTGAAADSRPMACFVPDRRVVRLHRDPAHRYGVAAANAPLTLV